MVGNASAMLYMAFKNLNDAAYKSLDGTKIEEMEDTVNTFAISAAVAGAATDVVPGLGGVLAVLTQTGLVWTLYVKINKTLGISISEHKLKFLGSAIVTNIVTNAGGLIVGYAAAAIMSFIPLFGQASSAVIHLALGYILIYAAAIIYLNFLTRTFKANGSFDFKESANTKIDIEKTVKGSDMKGIINEGKKNFNDAKKNGDIDRAKENPKCPNCGEPIKLDQKYCTNCGLKLKKD